MNKKKFLIDPIKEQKKYCNLLEFYKILPNLRKDIQYTLKYFEYNNKIHIIYLILAIIDLCNFRIGNEKYKKSIGTSTIRSSNIANCSNNKLESCSYIEFNGKRQVLNQCYILNEKIHSILMNLSEYKNDDEFIFTYNNGNKVTASDVNDLLKTYGNVSTKMFRTWKANYYFIKTILSFDIPKNKSEIKKNISNSVLVASEKLHHSKNICRRSYLDSRIINIYRENPYEFYKFINKIPIDTNMYVLEHEYILKNILYFLCNSYI